MPSFITQIKKALLTEENCTNFIKLLAANKISLIGETIDELEKSTNELTNLLHNSTLNPNLKQRLQSAISNFIQHKITNHGINLLSYEDLKLASYYSSTDPSQTSKKRKIDTILETEGPNKKLKLAQDKVKNYLEELDQLKFYPLDDLRQINQRTNGEEILKTLFELHHELIKRLTKNQIIQIALVPNTNGSLFKNNCTNFIKLTELNKQIIYDDHILIKILIYNTTDLIITNYPKIHALNLSINEIADITCFIQNGANNLQVFLEKFEPLSTFGLKKSQIIASARNYDGNLILLKIETILNTLSAAGFTIEQFKQIFIIPDFFKILEEIDKLYSSHHDWTFEPGEIIETIRVTNEFNYIAFAQKKINSLSILKASKIIGTNSPSDNLLVTHSIQNLDPSNQCGFFSNPNTIPINTVTPSYYDTVQNALNNMTSCESFKKELATLSIPYNLPQTECNQFLVKIPALLADSSLDNKILISLCLSWLNNLGDTRNGTMQMDNFWQQYRNTLYNHLWEFTHIVLPFRILNTQFTLLRNLDETPAVSRDRENFYHNTIYILKTAQNAVSKYPDFKTRLIDKCINWSEQMSDLIKIQSASPESNIFANKVIDLVQRIIADIKYISYYVAEFNPVATNSSNPVTKLSGPNTTTLIDLTTSNPTSPLPLNENTNEPTSRSSTSPYTFFNSWLFTPSPLNPDTSIEELPSSFPF
ncbi:MAG TPA: hypothetical protein PK657_08355 [Legionella sp.]|nr:hypothetical protein [Legionella sp.]